MLSEKVRETFCYNRRMLRELLHLPMPIVVILIVGGSALLAVAATYLVRRSVDEKIHQSNNEVAGFIFAAVAVIYGVLLAFLVLVVWQTFENAQRTVEHEANALVNLFRLGQEFPEPYGELVQTLAVEYAQNVIQAEWPAMENSRDSAEVEATIEKLWEIHRALDAENKQSLVSPVREPLFFQNLDALGNDRSLRLLESRSEIPPLLWGLLICGAVVTIGFTLFFRAPNFKAHLLMAGLFAGLVAFILLLIVELDNPFAGDIKALPTAFQQALQLFQELRGN